MESKNFRVCFFAHVKDKKLFEIVDFYRNDIRILKELGFNVIIANRFVDIPFGCDLYFVWFWSWGWEPLIKAKLSKKPIIITGGLPYQAPREFGYFRRSFLIQKASVLTMKLADMNLAISTIELEGFHSLGIFNSCLVPLGIDTEYYTLGDLPFESRNIILSISHLNRWNVRRKKLDLVIKAFPYVLEQVPNVKLVIAGTKEKGFEDLKLLAESLHVDKYVEFPGRVSTEEKLKLYQKAKVFVQPSVFEAFGLAQAEAMSCGVPVVTSRAGALNEVVGEAGILMEIDDPEEIARCITKLYRGKPFWTKLSQAGRRRIEEMFSYDRRKSKIKELLCRFLKQD